MPYQGSPLIDGMLSMPLGTPMNEVEYPIRSPDYKHRTQDLGTFNPPMYTGGPTYRQMTHTDELARSRQIIEIGAMVVTNRSKIDPSLEPQASRTHILKSLEDIEKHLKETTDEEALRGCKLIREALVKTTAQEGIVDTEEILDEDLEAPSKVLKDSDYDVFSGLDDNEIMAMLMKHNGGNEEPIEVVEDNE